METPTYNPVARHHHPGLPLVIGILATIIIVCGYLVAANTWSFWPYSPSTTPTSIDTCIPRPACLDATPRCLPPEPAEGWCK